MSLSLEARDSPKVGAYLDVWEVGGAHRALRRPFDPHHPALAAFCFSPSHILGELEGGASPTLSASVSSRLSILQQAGSIDSINVITGLKAVYLKSLSRHQK